MENDPVIRSRSNALLKRVGAALSGKTPEILVLEGDRLIDDALVADFEVEVVLVAEDREQRARELEAGGVEVRRVEPELLARASSLESSPGILALAPRPAARGLESLEASGVQRVLVVANLQDPGNLGALARTAEAAGFGALVVLRGGARPFGPKALRGSMGSLLRLLVCEASEPESTRDALATKGYRQVCATTRGGTNWREFDWSAPLALWTTGETGRGLESLQGLDGVTIPMAGRVESLNVTVATSLLLFAAGGVE